MNKAQFLEILGQKLSEELPRNRVISNLQYYESYIDGAIRAGKSEREVLEELGDPYMIAHTILDTETGEAFYEQQFAEDAVFTQTETTFAEKDGKYTAETGETDGDAFGGERDSRQQSFEKAETYSENEYQRSNNENRSSEDSYQSEHVHHVRTNHGCLIMAIILILIVVVVVTLVGKVIRFLWPVLAPILLILLVVSIFSDKRR